MDQIDLTKLDTEKNNPRTRNIDRVSTVEILQQINREDQEVAGIVQGQIPALSDLVEGVYQALASGGRLIYVGAGTSGRLGILDASECPPTYGVSPDLVQALIAGGPSAILKAVEGAEDDAKGGKADLLALALTDKDFVLGLAASGRTPYVLGALAYASQIGAKTGAISCVAQAALSGVVDYPVELVTGPEVITGSTRMKAGTAQKMALNMISTAVMIRLGKVYHNYMVDVQPTNDKLVARSISMIQSLTECSLEEAQELFQASGQSVKTALVMHLHQMTKDQALAALDQAQGRIAQIKD